MKQRKLAAACVLGLAIIGRTSVALAQYPLKTTDLTMPIDQQLFNPVSAEPVRITGQLTTRADVRLESSGRATVKLTKMLVGTGKGQTSGAAYQIIGADESTATLPWPLPSKLVAQLWAELVGPQSQRKVRVNVRIEVTINADGQTFWGPSAPQLRVVP